MDLTERCRWRADAAIYDLALRILHCVACKGLCSGIAAINVQLEYTPDEVIAPCVLRNAWWSAGLSPFKCTVPFSKAQHPENTQDFIHARDATKAQNAVCAEASVKARLRPPGHPYDRTRLWRPRPYKRPFAGSSRHLLGHIVRREYLQSEAGTVLIYACCYALVTGLCPTSFAFFFGLRAGSWVDESMTCHPLGQQPATWGDTRVAWHGAHAVCSMSRAPQAAYHIAHGTCGRCHMAWMPYHSARASYNESACSVWFVTGGDACP